MKKQIFLFATLLTFMLLSCNKNNETPTEEPEPVTPDLLLKIYNSSYSQHYLYAFDTRLTSTILEEDTADWSGNIMDLVAITGPGDSTQLNLDLPYYRSMEFRIGVITNEGAVLMLHQQWGYIDEKNTINRGSADTLSMWMTIRSDDQGFISLSYYNQ
jgi:hypothetical protein